MKTVTKVEYFVSTKKEGPIYSCQKFYDIADALQAMKNMKNQENSLEKLLCSKKTYSTEKFLNAVDLLETATETETLITPYDIL